MCKVREKGLSQKKYGRGKGPPPFTEKREGKRIYVREKKVSLERPGKRGNDHRSRRKGQNEAEGLRRRGVLRPKNITLEEGIQSQLAPKGNAKKEKIRKYAKKKNSPEKKRYDTGEEGKGVPLSVLSGGLKGWGVSRAGSKLIRTKR